MSAVTKAQARRKLNAIMQKIGYPDVWRDYGTLTIDPSLSAAENLRRAAAFEAHRQLTQIGKPVDRAEWGMTPATVNAYYNPQINEIVFPAGILQPPFFVPTDDEASNYGAIGMVIGHEITHGFDDEGRQYDAEGNLKSWWTPEDDKSFNERARAVVEQYNGYIGVDTLHVNGQLTLGENIADIGGLVIAYHAWKLSLKGKPEPQTVNGLTPDQRFFIGYAQSWRSKVRPEALRTQVLTNPHSPAEWRVNGAVADMPEFHRAFGCEAEAAAVKARKRATIW
jgi:predicted metalloendopeptidase